MLRPVYLLPDLAALPDFETPKVLKALIAAHKSLAELKGRAEIIPNQGILIDSLVLQEAKLSSEIENIVTTQDELFRAELLPRNPESAAVKEVTHYRDALLSGFRALKEQRNIISNTAITDMFQILKGHNGGYRQTPGTVLRNDRTGENVYIPPQDKRAIEQAMDKLLQFINEDSLSAADPLIKMALIHHQFESIHPFSDGNGRIGRILNILYVTRTGLLDIPILYLSRAINSSKDEYYRLLQGVRDKGEWEPWILYILNAVDKTAQATLKLIEHMRAQMAAMKKRLREELPHLYSQDLLNNMFRHPYTRTEYMAKDLKKSRQTAAKYLDELAAKGFVTKHTIGRNNYYINEPLVRLFYDNS